MFDTLEHFYFQKSNARGSAVRLQESWQTILARRAYPKAVERLLGEMTAGAVMLAGSISYDGPVVLQVMGDGPVKMAMVEVSPQLGVRAVARLAEDAGDIPENAGLKDLVNVHGKGRCALTLVHPDPSRRTESYQGIVDLNGENVADALSSYMTKSEQVETRMWLSADAAAASGLMLQKVAAEGGKAPENEFAPEDWSRVQTLADTITAHELLTLEPREILTRLFWEENPVMGEPRSPSFSCSCSEERVAGMIQSLGREEAENIVKEQGAIEVTCEFCGKTYRFDSIDVARIFDSRISADTVNQH